MTHSYIVVHFGTNGIVIDGGPATPIIGRAWVGARPAPSQLDENTLGLPVERIYWPG
jgi:hypothetical protein